MELNMNIKSISSGLKQPKILGNGHSKKKPLELLQIIN